MSLVDAPDRAKRPQWKAVHSKPVQDFIEKFGGQEVTPELFHECLEYSREHLTPDQKFELILWLVAQVRL